MSTAIGLFDQEFIKALAAELAPLLARQNGTPLPSTHSNGKRLYSVKEAAEYLGRTESGVRQMIHQGKIKVVRLDGRVQLDRADLDDYIEMAKC